MTTLKPSETAPAGLDAPLAVDVMICTFRRDFVADTMRSVDAQEVPPNWRLRVIVADNDETPSAEERVRAAAADMRLPVVYVHAPSRNISIARNACLDAVDPDADWAAFIDDDEVAEPDWISELIAAAVAQGAEVVFGPAEAGYPDHAPKWMRENDFHSNRPTKRGEVTETGYSSNVAMKWRDGRARDERFLLSLGRTGGEDVEYFFRLHRKGARMGPAERAVVHEPVAPKRLTYDWVWRRRFTLGRIYGCNKPNGKLGARISLFASASAKAAYCLGRSALSFYDSTRFGGWSMRFLFHCGVCAGCLAPPSREVYGVD